MKATTTILALAVTTSVMAQDVSVAEFPTKFLYGEPPVATINYAPFKEQKLPYGLGYFGGTFGAGSTLDRNIPVYAFDVQWRVKADVGNGYFAYAGLVGSVFYKQDGALSFDNVSARGGFVVGLGVRF